MRTRKALLNTFTSLIYQVIAIISGLIVPRLILATYGSEYNGVVSSVTQFMSIISLLIIGLTAATRVEFYKSLANKNEERTSKILYTTKSYMHKVAWILALYIIVLAFIYPFFAHTVLDRGIIMALILVIGLSSFFEYYLGIPYRILLQADQNNYIENIVVISACFLYTTLSVVLIRNNHSLITVKLISAIISLISMLIICIYVRKKYHLKKESEKISMPLRRDAAVHSIANIIHQNSDVVILTLFLDVKLVSVYTVYYFVIGQIKKIVNSFTDGLESAFGNLWAKGEFDLLSKRFSQYEFLVFYINIIIYTCTLVLILPFIKLYTKGVNDVNYIRPGFALLFVVTEIIYCIRQPYVTIIQAAGKYKETKTIAIIEAISNLFCTVFFVPFWGIFGALIGTLIANLIRTFYYIFYVYKEILHIRIINITKRFSWFVITIIIAYLITNCLLTRLLIEKWTDWIICGIIAVLITVTITTINSLLIQKSDFFGLIKVIRTGFQK